MPLAWNKISGSNRVQFPLNEPFHEAIRNIICVANFVGVMPMSTGLHKDSRPFSFEWKTVYVFISCICMIFGILKTVLFTIFLFSDGPNIIRAGNFP